MEILVSFCISSILLTLTPGPDLFMVIGQSIEKGFRLTFVFILGLVSGLLVHTLLLVVGWAQFIGDRPEVVSAMKLIGAIYFFFLASKQLFNDKEKKPLKPTEDSTSNMYLKGIIMSSLNPKVSLFFWLFFPGFLFNSDWSISLQYALLGGLFLLQALMVFSLVAYFSTYFSSYIHANNSRQYNGLLFLLIGVYLLIAPIKA